MFAEIQNNQGIDEEDLLAYAERLGHGEVHIKVDHKTGLKAIIALHSTKLGPAIGGTRCIRYPGTMDAMRDAIRLSYMMSYKAAICGLKHGGGKSVIMKPADMRDRKELFTKFGEFVDSVGGRYIAAMDSGTNMSDMDAIAKSTKHVTCTSDSFGNGDPSPYTALGVLRGIEAALKFKHDREDLKDLHVAIQGVGHVGYFLAKILHEKGAKLTVTDIKPEHVQRCVDEFGAKSVEPDEICGVPCDVFAPCALGAVINPETIEMLQTEMIVGSANNVLSKMSLDNELHQRGILYAPDFLVNAGGLIHVAALYDHNDPAIGEQQVNNIYDELLKLLLRAKKEDKPTNQIAVAIARERLQD